MKKRNLGQSDIRVTPMGIGGWAIGGQFYFDGMIDGYGQTDDQESIRAIHAALDMGINFIDTADAYGVGHSETVIGKALKSTNKDAVIATKFGFMGNESTQTLQGICLDPGYIKRACEASLRRLKKDTIDLYQLHVGDIHISEVEPILNTLEELIHEGKIRTYGWSTDIPTAARIFSEKKNCVAIQHEYNVLKSSSDILQICEEKNMTSINRSPLAMGILSGKFNNLTQLSDQDVRGAGHSWTRNLFENGRPRQDILVRLEAIKEILCSNGRTPAQGALAWIWAKSDHTLPIPGFKTVKQVEENIRALEHGPLTEIQMTQINQILGEQNT